MRLDYFQKNEKCNNSEDYTIYYRTIHLPRTIKYYDNESVLELQKLKNEPHTSLPTHTIRNIRRLNHHNYPRQR